MKDTLRVGKSGVTDSLVKELLDQLKANGKVKVKFMSNAVVDNEEFLELANNLAERSASKIIQKIGHTAVYQKTYKKNS